MNFEDAVEEMRAWLEIRALPGHFSSVLVNELARHWVNRTVSVFAVLDEIGKMQGTWRGKPLGKPEQFKHKPLAGLWKQHFFEPQNLFRNLINEADAHESAKLFEQLADALNRGEKPDKMIHQLVIGGFQRRAQAGRLTGEWIIYTKDDQGENYFLTLAKHFECEHAMERARHSGSKEAMLSSTSGSLHAARISPTCFYDLQAGTARDLPK